MKFPYISHNGKVISPDQINIAIDQTEVSYGFGVYETIKVRNGIIYFLPQHIDRLFHSAKEIKLRHIFTAEQIHTAVQELLAQSTVDSCNIKVLLYGASKQDDASFYIIPSAPLYPDRKWYRDGVSVIAFQYERWKPQAKTLNMLPSYVMYKEAQQQGCYDAILFDRNGNIREGTRTNVYLIKGKIIYSPPKRDILEGVTLMTLEKVLKNTPYSLEYKDIPFSTIYEYDCMFLTSTSTKIMPVKKIGNEEYPIITENVKELIQIYDEALDKSRGDFMQL